MKRLLLTFFLLGCGSDPSPKCDTSPVVLEIDQDQHGFVDTHKCDSTIWSGMMSAAGYEVDMTAAEKSPGEWYRRPTQYTECFSSGESFSTISRDQLLGVYWHAWKHKDLAMLERLWDYGVSHQWRMGAGRWFGADTVMNTAMISTLAQMIHRLGGYGPFAGRYLPVTWSVEANPDKYYVNRLTALHLMLRREAYGSIGPQAKNTLLSLTTKFAANPLFALANGDKCRARKLAAANDTPSGVHNDDEYIYERAFVIGMTNGR